MRRLVEDGYVSQREFDLADSTSATTEAASMPLERRQTQAEREMQQSEAEMAGRVLAVAQARQRVVELRATLARVESQRHQVTLKEAEIGRAEARLTETQGGPGLRRATTAVHRGSRAHRRDGLEAERRASGRWCRWASRSWPSCRLHDVWVIANLKETQLGAREARDAAVVRDRHVLHKTLSRRRGLDQRRHRRPLLTAASRRTRPATGSRSCSACP